MPGRGRGRGSGLTFNVEAIGFGRGDALPSSLLRPPPDYPPLKRRPVPLLTGEDQKYMLALQQNFEKTMRNSPYYIKKQEEKHFLNRYSDKYSTSNHSDYKLGWEPNWDRLPAELKIKKKQKRTQAKLFAPKIVERQRAAGVNDEEMKQKLEELEKKDSKNPDLEKGEGENKDSEDGSEVEHDIDDGEDEAENDYLNSYFDNGESFLDEEEDTLDDKDGGIY